MRYALDGKYPIETAAQLIKAAEYFDKNLPRFHPDERVKIASSIDNRANELKVNVDRGWITNYTRMEKTASISPSFENSMKMRKEACIRHRISLPGMEVTKEAKYKCLPCEIIKGIVKEASSMSPKDLLNVVAEFDKRAGIEYLYDQQILDPYITVFGDLNNPEFDAIKVAGDATHYDVIRASRDQEKIAAVKDKLGDGFASKFQDNPISAINELGSPEKTVLSVIMR